MPPPLPPCLPAAVIFCYTHTSDCRDIAETSASRQRGMCRLGPLLAVSSMTMTLGWSLASSMTNDLAGTQRSVSFMTAENFLDSETLPVWTCAWTTQQGWTP